jgi:hypothetical protein
VPGPMTREEGHAPIRHCPDRDRPGGRTERRFDVDGLHVVEERIEPRSTEDTDPNGTAGSRGAAQADRSFDGLEESRVELSDFPPSDFAPSDFPPSDFPPSDFPPSDFEALSDPEPAPLLLLGDPLDASAATFCREDRESVA